MKTITKFIYAGFAVVIAAMGVVTANGALGDLYASIDGNGSNGGGLIYRYMPRGVQSIFGSGLSEPRGVAFDHFGNLFVANTSFDVISHTFQATIKKITPDGVQSTFATLSGNFFAEGLAFDSSGNLYLMVQDHNNPDSASTIYKFTPGGVQSMFGAVPGQGFGLAFDSAGNLFAADTGLSDSSGQTIWKFTPSGTRSVFASPAAFIFHEGPVGLALDRFGNLFVSTGPNVLPPPNGEGRILEFTPGGMETTFAYVHGYDRGLAFDLAGNLFVAEVFGDDILKFTPQGVRTVFAQNISVPEFLAFQLLPTPTPAPCGKPVWVERAPVPYSPDGMFAASDGTFVYAGGGIDGSGIHNDLLRYDPVANIWTPLASSPDGHLLSQAVYFNGKIYNIGGVGAGFNRTNTTRIYDIASNTWNTGAPMPAGLSDMATILWNGTIYIAGGITGSMTVNTLYAYNIASNTWSTLAPMPDVLLAAGFGAINGKLYVAGGNNNTGPVDTLYIYDIASNTWTNGVHMPVGVWEPGSAVLNGKLYVYGGYTLPGFLAVATTQIYDPVSNTWSIGPDMNVARAEFYGTAVGHGGIVAPGGVGSNSNLNDNEQLILNPCGKPIP
jgi:hypothetical protein